MLKVTRRFGERVVIGDNIIIDINMIRGNKVGLTISAPREIPVEREELLAPERVRLVEARAKEGHTCS